MTQNIKNV